MCGQICHRLRPQPSKESGYCIHLYAKSRPCFEACFLIFAASPQHWYTLDCNGSGLCCFIIFVTFSDFLTTRSDARSSWYFLFLCVFFPFLLRWVSAPRNVSWKFPRKNDAGDDCVLLSVTSETRKTRNKLARNALECRAGREDLSATEIKDSIEPYGIANVLSFLFL